MHAIHGHEISTINLSNGRSCRNIYSFFVIRFLHLQSSFSESPTSYNTTLLSIQNTVKIWRTRIHHACNEVNMQNIASIASKKCHSTTNLTIYFMYSIEILSHLNNTILKSSFCNHRMAVLQAIQYLQRYLGVSSIPKFQSYNGNNWSSLLFYSCCSFERRQEKGEVTVAVLWCPFQRWSILQYGTACLARCELPYKYHMSKCGHCSCGHRRVIITEILIRATNIESNSKVLCLTLFSTVFNF